MSEFTVKLPDVGEGIAEAELVEWHVAVGDLVREDEVLAAVMTDKATVEIPAPREGRVLWLGGEVGSMLAVGSALVRLGDVAGGSTSPETASADASRPSPEPAASAPASAPMPRPDAAASPASVPPAPAATSAPAPVAPSKPAASADTSVVAAGTARAATSARPLAAPAVRQRARDLGIDLRFVRGSGPAGRITHADIERHGSDGPVSTGRVVERTEIKEVKVVGLRRKIAEKMALSKSRIPHITIVEEVDVTALEDLRAVLNKTPQGEARLTILPFLMRAMAIALDEQPALNALYDDDAGIVRQHAAIDIGIATQTPNGLVVPVVRHVEALGVWACAQEVDRLARRARDGSATRNDLTGSTITITSLGALGAIATTPVINYPEVAIVGVNRMAIRPMWNGTTFVPRKMMNLSSSFDHRVIDGWDAAVFVQRLKALLETPALIFMDKQP